MIRINAAKHATPNSKGVGMTLTCNGGSSSSSRPVVLTRPRCRRPGTQVVLLKTSTRNYGVVIPSRLGKPLTSTPTSTTKSSTIRDYREIKPFSTSATTLKPQKDIKASKAVEGDVIYRKEGGKIIPVSAANQVESPVSGLFSQFEGFSKASTSEEVTPIKNDDGAVDLSSITLDEMLPHDEVFVQLITQKNFNVTLDDLKEELQRIVAILPLSEDDPKRLAVEKEFSKFCKKQSVNTYYLASILIQYTRGGAPLSLALFKIGIDNGDFLSKYSYGVMIYRGARGVPANPAKGRAIIESLAMPSSRTRLKPNPHAMATLASIYARDDKNFKAARDLYIEAANKGAIEARVALGRMYLSGEIERDPIKARKCFEHVVKFDDENAEAHFLLGSMDIDSLTDESGKAETNEAKRLAKQKSSFLHYQKAASRGMPEAQYNLGYAYMKGTGVTQNDALAIEYWKMSAQQGFGLAQLNLGMYYFQEDRMEGLEDGTFKNLADPSKRDLMQAQKWFTLASRRPGVLGEHGKLLKAKVDEAIKKGGGGRSKNGGICTIM
ncbi:hypothetical protein BGZ76_004622 [Entomortierella beljakovae]|nr:hypothetical protein BGZ76_004622 [Entomortierella beljakovae]